MTDANLRWRLRAVVLLFALAWIAVLAKAYVEQVVRAEETLAKAMWRTESVVEIVGPRGPIMDRDGAVLAESVSAFDVFWDPRTAFTTDADRLEDVLAFASRFEGFDPEAIPAYRMAEPGTLPGHRALARGLSPEEAAEHRAWLRERRISSVGFTPSFRRVYPNGALAGRAIGFMNGHWTTGVSGVEAVFDDVLTGRTIEVDVERANSREMFMLGDVPDIIQASGAAVELTVDIDLQLVVEQALTAAVERFEAASALAVVTRVGTGEILAMGSVPGLDPHEGAAAAGVGWVEPVIANQYEPGSTAKIFTFAAALDQGLITYDTVLDCAGGALRVDRYTIRDRHCPDTIEAWDVLRHSSNIGAIRIASRMTQASHLAYLEGFGFGESTGIALAGEARGDLPDLDRPWAESTHAALSYGYGLAVTPLQLNIATAVIANGGVRVPPYLVERVVDAAGTELHRAASPEPVRVISEDAARLTTRALVTVTGEEGTATAAAIPGFEVAGKTGTARIPGPGGYRDGEYRSFFTGFVPADDPRLVITVMVERPNPDIGYYAGTVAAPAFAAIARRALELDGVTVVPRRELSAPSARPAGVPHAEPTEGLVAPSTSPSVVGARRVPDFEGMSASDVLEVAAALDLEVSIEGVGVAASQSVSQDTPIGPGMRVHVRLEEPPR